MNRMTSYLRLSALLVMATVLTACGAMQKEPAEKALAAVESAVGSINKDDVEKYLPGGLNDIDSSLASLKTSLTSGDYKAVIAGAPALTAKVSELTGKLAEAKAAAEAKLQELAGKWTSLSSELPGMLQAISGKVAELSKGKLPKGMSKEAVESAKTGLAGLQLSWTDASAAFTGGDMEGAVGKAEEIKGKAAEIMTSLGLST